MKLGERVRAARLEKGLSQRQLCGEFMTRNMLSQIENGSARPSMASLVYLARQLEKPLSWFLEEQTVTSPNTDCMEAARTALALQDWEGLRRELDAFREPDAAFCEERQLLEFYWHLAWAREALAQGRESYGRSLLERALALEGLYLSSLRQSAAALLILAGGQAELEADDTRLLALAKQTEDPARGLALLEAAEDRTQPQWNWAMGECLFALARYREAQPFYEKAPQNRETWARLEICCREQEDYRGAYEWACKAR